MINTDLSVQKRWVARRSFNNSFTLTITSGGSAYNVSSYTFSANIRKIGASTNSLQLTEGSGITNGGATGIVTVQLSAANSETLTVGSYYYEVNYTVSSLSYGLLHGTFDLLSEYNPESENNAVSISVNLAGTDVNVAIALNGLGAATQAQVNAGTATDVAVTPATLSAKALKTGTYSTELTFDTDKDIYQDVTSPTFTLAASGNINGVGIILRLNTPTSVTFPANFEAHANSATLDATKLNVYTLVYFSNWNGSGTARVIYTNSLFTAI